MTFTHDADRMLTSTEADQYLKKAPGYLAKARVAGTGPRFLKVGRSILYRQSAIDAWLAACECGSTSDYLTRRGG